MPACDKFAKCLVVADSVQTGVWAVDATTMLRKKLRSDDFGCNSRRLHLKAHLREIASGLSFCACVKLAPSLTLLESPFPGLTDLIVI